MKRSAKIGLIVIIAFWLLFFIGLIIAANLPVSKETANAESLGRKTHPEDGYTYLLKSGWQTAETGAKRLLITNEEDDAAILFLLETGGYDYKSTANIAKELIAAMTATYGDDVSFDEGSPAVANAAYEGITFSGTILMEDETYNADYYVFHPATGIRLYAVCTYPPSLPRRERNEAEAIVSSVLFPDVTLIYEKYMTQTEEEEETEAEPETEDSEADNGSETEKGSQ